MSPTKKEELRKYEDELISKNFNDLFSNGIKSGQSWKSSLLEAHVNSLIGAPLAILAHIGLLIWSGIEPNLENAALFASASWPVFFYLSVGRIYLFRRIFNRYGIALEPIAIYRKIKSKLFVNKSEQNGTT